VLQSLQQAGQAKWQHRVFSEDDLALLQQRKNAFTSTFHCYKAE